MKPKSSDKCLDKNEAEGDGTRSGGARVKTMETDVLRLQNPAAPRG